MDIENKYEKFMKGAKDWPLSHLPLNDLNEYGIWCVRGEDPNPDLGGSHSEPVIGYFEGKLDDVIHVAVELPSFWVGALVGVSLRLR